MRDLDTLARHHAQVVNRALADAEPPPVESLGSAPQGGAPRPWRRGIGVAAAAAALVLAVVVPMALLSDGDGGIGEAPGARGSTCQLPPEDERTAPPATFTLSISPSVVEAGDIAGLSMDFGDAPPEDAVTGAGAAWQCWDGAEWIDTHQLVKDVFGPDDRPTAIEVQPGATTTIPAVGISVAEPHGIVIPDVEPGIYRIRDEVFYGGESYEGYAVVLVAAATSLGEGDPLEGVPESCPVTVPGYDAFTPFSEMPEGPPPVYDQAWYGTPQLWTKLSTRGEATSGRWEVRNTFWWSEAYSPQDPGEFTVTARQLDGSAPVVEASEEAGTGYSPFKLMPTHESVTNVWIELPEPGCWELTAEYKGTTLSYVIWVDDDMLVGTGESAPASSLTLRYARRGGFYTEGSATEFDVLSSSYGRVTSGAALLPSDGDQILRIDLAPGTYTIRSWQRPCPGSCGDSLEPPTDMCAVRFTVEDEPTISAVVTVEPSVGCTFDVEGVEAVPVDPRGYAALSLTFPVAGEE